MRLVVRPMRRRNDGRGPNCSRSATTRSAATAAISEWSTIVDLGAPDSRLGVGAGEVFEGEACRDHQIPFVVVDEILDESLILPVTAP